MARLLLLYQEERGRSIRLGNVDAEQFDAVLNTLVNGAMDDLTSAVDLLDRWGLMPESYR